MDVGPLKEYFKPLKEWLEKRVGTEGHDWSNDCTHMTIADEAKQWLDEYEVMAEDAFSRSTEADWNYATNIKQETEWKRVNYYKNLTL